MNTIGFIKTASFTFKLTSHFSASANPFLTQLRNQPLKNAARFENKNLTWTFDEFETHSNAFAYGLVELGY